MLSRIEAKFIKLSQNIFYFFVWNLYAIVLLPFVRLNIEGKENIPKKGRFILAANHQNFVDGFFISYPLGPLKRPTFVVAKRALKFKIFQILAKLIGSVLICNELEEYQRTLKKLNRVLSHGGVVGIFPEGDISNSKIPKKFKGGVSKLSIDSTSKVIPAYIDGTFGLRNFKYWLLRPEITIKFGEPLDLYNYSPKNGNNLDEIAVLLREKIIELSGLKEFKKLNSKTFSNVSSYAPIIF